MKTAAVIVEYNPFHKGHAWQISQLRQRGASHIAVVMSPDFTQRGTPAILPKRVRAAAALQGGADLVLELPVCYACAGAQGFAFGAVQLIGAMGCVDWLGFGAEDADLALLEQAANALEHPQVQLALKEELAAASPSPRRGSARWGGCLERGCRRSCSSRTTSLRWSIWRSCGAVPRAASAGDTVGAGRQRPRRRAGAGLCLGQLPAGLAAGRGMGAGGGVPA